MNNEICYNDSLVVNNKSDVTLKEMCICERASTKEELPEDVQFKINVKCNEDFIDFAEKIEKESLSFDIDENCPANISSVQYDALKLYFNDISCYKLLSPQEEAEYARYVQTGILAQKKLNAFNSNKLDLTLDEVNKLNDEVEDGYYYRDMMFNSNTRLVVNIAKRFLSKGLSFDDVIQNGNQGLLKAIDKFDPNLGFRFSTYASFWIVQTIQRGIATDARMVRLPVHHLEFINKIHMVEAKLENKLSRKPTVEEVSKELGITTEDYVNYFYDSRSTSSLDAPVDEDEETFGIDLAEDKETDSAFEFASKAKKREDFLKAINRLNEKERMIIKLRFGFEDGKSRTLDKVGQIMGLTRERVRQIEKIAIEKLKVELKEYNSHRSHSVVRK